MRIEWIETLRHVHAPAGEQKLLPWALPSGTVVRLYPRSVTSVEGAVLCMTRNGMHKRLLLFAPAGNRLFGVFDRTETVWSDGSGVIISIPRSHQNVLALQGIMPSLRPAAIGPVDSFGLGDRIGLANPAHLRAILGTRFVPVLAQQSIRELERTGRTPEEVMDAAVWAVVQEGYRETFGADADHLKTTADIDRMAAAGYTMFTFDPGAFVVNGTEEMDAGELHRRAREVPLAAGDTVDAFASRYAGHHFSAGREVTVEPDRERVLRVLVKYGGVVSHAFTLYEHLAARMGDTPFEVELSVDETDTPTTPEEHFIVACELRRCGVKLVSLAPRFVGDFEKGVDFKGDIALFKREYRRHLAVAEELGPYKLSIHSGSDKFTVYDAIGSEGNVHVKTAGTSYLEALRTVAVVEPSLFREILVFSRDLYDSERRTYHVSAALDRVPAAETMPDREMPGLLDNDDVRQVLHVTFGRVLTDAGPDGTPLFHDRIYNFLQMNEEVHYGLLVRHFRRHLEPFARTEA